MIDGMLTRRQLSTSALIAAGLALTGPGLRSSARGSGDGDTAMETATTYSQFENTGNIWPLYQRMHSDAREIIPFYAVDYWYASDFTPRGPELIETTGVAFVDWTWEVTGTMYPGTAEVAYTQAFADGSTVEDVVRLVLEDDEWRWFFGRDRAFVDEQIRLSGEEVYPADPSDTPDWVEDLAGVGADTLNRLRDEYPGTEDATIDRGPAAGGEFERRYALREGFTVARVEYQPVPAGQSASSLVRAELDRAARVPGFNVLAWDVRPESDLSFAIFEQSAGEVNSDFVHLVVADTQSGNVWLISAPDQAAIETLSAVLVG